jgi:hypothetical protein
MLELAAVFCAGIVCGWFVLPQPEWAKNTARALGLLKD